MSLLRDLIDEMVTVEHTLGRTALEAREDPSRKSAVIELRRRFANLVKDVLTAMDDDAQLRSDPELSKEFRHRFSEMRSKIAIFQAKWPAVLLDNNDPDFVQSGRELIASNRTFTDWAQLILEK